MTLEPATKIGLPVAFPEEFLLRDLPRPHEGSLFDIDLAPDRNQQRGLFVAEAMRTYAETTGVSDEAVELVIRDMLGDMRHLCDSLGLSYSELDRRAHSSYRSEIGGEG
jgi:hypothetical protein